MKKIIYSLATNRMTRSIVITSVIILVMGLTQATSLVPAASGADVWSELDTATKSTGFYDDPATSDTLEMRIASMIQTALSVVGIILLILIIYGGFLWMTAGGNEEKVGKARKILKNAVIGILIVFMAYGIAEFVVSRVETSSEVAE